jgi:YggT family protein
MDILVKPLLSVVLFIIDLFKMCVVSYIILGWLETFNIVNTYNKFVYTVHNVLFSIVEPFLSPLRRFIPTISGMDLSPIVLFLAIYFVQNVIGQILIKIPS